jgi:hypothetical protein
VRKINEQEWEDDNELERFLAEKPDALLYSCSHILESKAHRIVQAVLIADTFVRLFTPVNSPILWLLA